MKAYSIILLFCLWAGLLPQPLTAQFLGGVDPTVNIPNDLVQSNWVVEGRVKTLQGDPVRAATVLVMPLVSAGPRSLPTDAQGGFHTVYQVNLKEIAEFSLILTVKKKGYQTAHAYVDFGSSAKTWVIPVTLREPQGDPGLLSLDDLTAALAPKLRQLGPADGLSEKNVKDYARGVAEFLDEQRFERAIPLLYRVQQKDATCLGCRTMLGLAELSWGDWEGANRTLAEGVNAMLSNPHLACPELLVTYGTLVSWQHEPDKARPYFLEALKSAPQNSLALQELGRALLATQNCDAAADILQKALAAGAGGEARLLYADALSGAGHPQAATDEMNRYLDGRDVKKMPVRVRQVYANLQNRQKVENTYARTQSSQSSEHAEFLHHPPPDLIRGLAPALNQDPLSDILNKAGSRIEEMVKNFPNTSSQESIHQEKLARRSGLGDAQNQKFRYLCVVPQEAWGPSFVEYRADFAGNEAAPKGLSEGFMLTKGFASTALFFHPSYRNESNFVYLGSMALNGRSTYVMAFAQIPGKAHLKGDFFKGQIRATTFSQGLAWIDASTYQIIRMHTELLAPLSELHLENETMDIEFNEVHFNQTQYAFWLPASVTVTLGWNGRQLRNTHAYSDYKVFNVDATEKIGKPKASAQPPARADQSADSP